MVILKTSWKSRILFRANVWIVQWNVKDNQITSLAVFGNTVLGVNYRSECISRLRRSTFCVGNTHSFTDIWILKCHGHCIWCSCSALQYSTDRVYIKITRPALVVYTRNLTFTLELKNSRAFKMWILQF